MKLSGLSRQIALSMMIIALGVTFLVIITAYIFYYLFEKYWPEYFLEMGLYPTAPELVWIVGTTVVGLCFAICVAIGLSHRILEPLNSVTHGIRRLAQGEMDVRAENCDRSLGEAALLVDDFNTLANKLQQMTKEQAFWNAAIAHELRTPVTILRGRLQGLADGVLTPNSAQFQSLLGQVEGLTRLIEDLRVVSLVESNHLKLQFQEVDLAAEIGSIAEFCSEALHGAGLVLQLHVDNQKVFCDSVRIRQAMLALLENARQHAEPGTVRIESRLENGQCSLSIEDNGPGISDELIPYVFQAFRRGDITRSGTVGSGLGLAVVAAIAHAHDGQAKCERTINGGTKFTLTWPNKRTTCRNNRVDGN